MKISKRFGLALLATAVAALTLLLWIELGSRSRGDTGNPERGADSPHANRADGWFGTGTVAAPGMHEHEPVPREVPADLAARARPWSPKVGTYEKPVDGEEAPVRAYSIDKFDPTRPGPPPEPFARPKIHLDKADIRAGLD